MPFRRYKRTYASRPKRTYGKRKYFAKKTKKSRFNSRQVLRNRAPGHIIPDTYFTKLKYSENLSLSGAFTTTFTVFRGNSVFDPDFSLGGHQPLGFDELAALYGKYRVHASACKVRITGQSGSTTPVRIAVYPALASTSFSNQNAMEQPYSKHTLTGGYGSNVATVKNYMSTKKINGMKSVAYEDNFAATTAANPSDQWYWIIDASTLSISNIAGVNGDFMITYYVEFFDRNQLTSA